MKILPNSVDAIIVLANHMDAEGNLNNESKERAELSLEIMKNCSVANIVTTGWAYRRNVNLSLAEVMKRYINERLPADCEVNFLIEDLSKDTVGEAVFTKVNFAAPMSWKKIIVVTSNYHIKRAKEIFNFVYGSMYEISFFGSKWEYKKSIVDDELSSISKFRETFFGINVGDDLMILRRLKESHPFYNGEIYPFI